MFANDHQFYETSKDVSAIQSNIKSTACKATKRYQDNYLKGNFDKYGLMLMNRNIETEILTINYS